MAKFQINLINGRMPKGLLNAECAWVIYRSREEVLEESFCFGQNGMPLICLLCLLNTILSPLSM